MLTVAQASLRLGKSVMTVHRMIAKGVLPVAHRLHGKTGAYLVWADDVARLAAEAAA
jgi:excisionase family DNA binding protein